MNSVNGMRVKILHAPYDNIKIWFAYSCEYADVALNATSNGSVFEHGPAMNGRDQGAPDLAERQVLTLSGRTQLWIRC